MASSKPKTNDLKQFHDQVDEIAVQMKKNRDMALEREGKLDVLNDRADDLREKATKFNTPVDLEILTPVDIDLYIREKRLNQIDKVGTEMKNSRYMALEREHTLDELNARLDRLVETPPNFTSPATSIGALKKSTQELALKTSIGASVSGPLLLIIITIII